MAKIGVKKGTTSRTIDVFIQDSSSLTGAGLAGLVYNSGGLSAYYHRNTDAAATVMALVTMTVGTWTSLGFKEIDAVHMPGHYQIGIPNACLATGADQCVIHLFGAANMAPLPLEIQLNDLDIADVMTTVMTESYAAKNAAPTLAQILFMIWSKISEAAIASTTETTKKLDQSTTAMTFGLDDATNPTSITRLT